MCSGKQGINTSFINFPVVPPPLLRSHLLFEGACLPAPALVYRGNHQSALKESRRTSNPLSHGVGSGLAEPCRVNRPVKTLLRGAEVAEILVRVPGVLMECARLSQGALLTMLKANSVGTDNQFSGQRAAARWL